MGQVREMAVMLPRLLGAVVVLAVAGMVTTAQAAPLTYRFESFIDATVIGRFSTASFALEWTFDPDAVGAVVDPPNGDPFRRYGGIAGTIWIDNEAWVFTGGGYPEGGYIDVKNDQSDSKWPDWFYLYATTITPPGVAPNLSQIVLWLGSGPDILDDLSLPTAGELSQMDLITAAIGVSNTFYNTLDGAEWTISDITAPPPIPAAFPLFATALAGLGLLGWRRKRKASASV